MNRNTVQKKIIIKAINRLYHPTAEDVHNEIIKEYENISLATVYRNLNKMVENNEVKRLRINSGECIYDINVHPHDHFFCNQCNRIIDIECINYDKLKQDIEKKYCVMIDDHEIVFTGICNDCIKKGIV